MGSTYQSHRLLWPDLVKGFAVTLVVYLHAITLDLSRVPFLTGIDAIAGVVFYVLALTCVPLFFMVNGYFLLTRQDESWLVFLRRRVLKVLSILLVWSLIYSAWKLAFVAEPVHIAAELRGLLNGTYFHLWFLAIMLRIMLFVPLMRKLVQGASDGLLGYAVCLCFIWGSLLPFAKHLAGGADGLSKTMFFGYFGYYLLGYLLGNRDCSKWAIRSCWAGLVLGLVGSVMGVYVLAFTCASSVGVLVSYLSPNVIVLTVCVFVLVRHHVTASCTRTPFAGFAPVGSMSLGIYLIHPMFMELAWKVGISAPLKASTPGLLVLTALTLGGSMIATVFIGRFPLLRRVLLP